MKYPGSPVGLLRARTARLSISAEGSAKTRVRRFARPLQLEIGALGLRLGQQRLIRREPAIGRAGHAGTKVRGGGDGAACGRRCGSPRLDDDHAHPVAGRLFDHL